jgi:hypothetical protein
MGEHPINRWSGVVPLLMSLVALLAVGKAIGNYRRYGPPLDEDTAWRVFALMMCLQPPIILYFIFRFRRELRRALPVLVAQVSLWAVCLGSIWYFPGIFH